jgi:CubicO group peptidase (beta-lactamase class C family)
LVAPFLFLALAGGASARGEESPLVGLDEYVHKALKEWKLPGLALAVVKDDKVILAKGYGVRKLDESAPVDEHTLFAIGSASKAFTAASLAMLADEGKLKWDDPVTKHLASFQLSDPWVTREITVRDLLAHRSGLNRHETLWYASPRNREQVIGQLRLVKPDWSFRGKFGYQNMMYLVAGQVVPALSGLSWDDFVKQRIFTPLGMSASNTSVAALSKEGNVATPHTLIEEKVEPIPWRNIDNVGPAGSINSNVVDMAQWVRLQLGEGLYQKKRLLSSGAVKEMHASQTVIPLEGTMAKMYPAAHFTCYGLGWFLSDYHSRKVVEHGGAIDGMAALVAMLPEEKLGLVILTNLSGNMLTSALKYRIFDAYLGVKTHDWSADFLKTRDGLLKIAKEAEKKQEKERVTGTKPSLALDKYAGVYKDELHGEVKVELKNDRLTLHYGPAFMGDLEHWNFDTFRAIWKDRQLGKSLVTFDLDARGKVREARVTLADMGSLDFKRDEAASDPTPTITLSEAELRKFAGSYELKSPPIEINIEMVGGKLKVLLPGQPIYSLAPVKPTRFKLEGAPAAIFVEFEMDKGKVKGLKVEQPGAPVLTLSPKK